MSVASRGGRRRPRPPARGGGRPRRPGLVVSTATQAVDRAMTQLAFDHADELIDQCPRPAREGPGGPGARRPRAGPAGAPRDARDDPARSRRARGRSRSNAPSSSRFGLEPGPDVFAAIYRRYLWLLMARRFDAVQRLADVVLAHAAAARGPEAADRFTLLGRLARGSVLWCFGDAEPAVHELERALALAPGRGGRRCSSWPSGTRPYASGCSCATRSPRRDAGTRRSPSPTRWCTRHTSRDRRTRATPSPPAG